MEGNPEEDASVPRKARGHVPRNVARTRKNATGEIPTVGVVGGGPTRPNAPPSCRANAVVTQKKKKGGGNKPVSP